MLYMTVMGSDSQAVFQVAELQAALVDLTGQEQRQIRDKDLLQAELQGCRQELHALQVHTHCLPWTL